MYTLGGGLQSRGLFSCIYLINYVVYLVYRYTTIVSIDWFKCKTHRRVDGADDGRCGPYGIAGCMVATLGCIGR